MLRKFLSDTGKDWDKWLPFLLFAYREVPQAYTGFSPFELLYGWPVQGPLDLLIQNWEKKVTTDGEKGQGVVQFVLQMRDRRSAGERRSLASGGQSGGNPEKPKTTYQDLQMDHRALTWIQTMKDRNARVTRWYLELQPFKFCVRQKQARRMSQRTTY